MGLSGDGPGIIEAIEQATSRRRTRSFVDAFTFSLYEGHEIIALVADRFLETAVRAKIAAMLDAHPDNLTAHEIASAATWADRYRDSDRNGKRYEHTRDWHFVDIEVTNLNLDTACFGHPPLPAGTVASNGPTQACIIDKIDQVVIELADPRADPEERLVALKFVLHLVRNLHQPLHTAGGSRCRGSRKRVVVLGFRDANRHLAGIRRSHVGGTIDLRHARCHVGITGILYPEGLIAGYVEPATRGY
jgi:hypothetical protein